MNDWREDSGLISRVEYKKRFSILPTICSDGTKIWMKIYYKKYQIWGTPGDIPLLENGCPYFHTDFIENITEQEFIIRRLTENF